MIRTDVMALLNLQVPVLSAPMAGIAGGALAAAVTGAGGLGLIGGAMAIARGSSASLTWPDRRGAVSSPGRSPASRICLQWHWSASPQR